MTSLSYWKIKRELRRILNNSTEILHEILRKLYFRRYYDLVVSKKIRRTYGALPLGNDVAIYLIFPTSGILESHRFVLDELRRFNISPIIVSNVPLNETERGNLLRDVAIVIERPNIGYDFGGYRDGIFEIADNFKTINRVWLLNDSTWMIPQSISWFEQARLMNKDFVGATSSFSILRKTVLGSRRWSASDYRSIVWNHNPANPDFHYASYALSIGSAILRDAKFLKFWKRLEIRNDKKWTVRRGEIGLTQWVLKNGYSHGATHEISGLNKELNSLSDEELDKAARELVIFNGTELVEIKKQVLLTDSRSKEGRLERISLILIAVARQGTAYALPLYNLRRNKFQFLKKSLFWLSSESPEKLNNFINMHDDRGLSYISEETQAICTSSSYRSDD